MVSVRDAGGDAHQPAIGSGDRQEIDLGLCAGAVGLPLQMGVGAAYRPGASALLLGAVRAKAGVAVAFRTADDGGGGAVWLCRSGGGYPHRRLGDRKSVAEGKSASVRGDLGGRRN